MKGVDERKLSNMIDLQTNKSFGFSSGIELACSVQECFLGGFIMFIDWLSWY